MSEEDAKNAYNRYTIPDTARVLFEKVFDDYKSSASDIVNFKNDNRGPLLLITGSEDHTVPAKLSRSNYDQYRYSKAVTDYKEFENRSHLIIVQEEWQEVSDYINNWLNQNLHS